MTGIKGRKPPAARVEPCSKQGTGGQTEKEERVAGTDTREDTKKTPTTVCTVFNPRDQWPIRRAIKKEIMKGIRNFLATDSEQVMPARKENLKAKSGQTTC